MKKQIITISAIAALAIVSPADAHKGKGEGHKPVTVCHLLGHGGYKELTFDKEALDAHLDHGDIYPVPEGGCPGKPTPEPTVVPVTPEPTAIPVTPEPTEVPVIPEPTDEPSPTMVPTALPTEVVPTATTPPTETPTETVEPTVPAATETPEEPTTQPTVTPDVPQETPGSTETPDSTPPNIGTPVTQEPTPDDRTTPETDTGVPPVRPESPTGAPVYVENDAQSGSAAPEEGTAHAEGVSELPSAGSGAFNSSQAGIALKLVSMGVMAAIFGGIAKRKES